MEHLRLKKLILFIGIAELSLTLSAQKLEGAGSTDTLQTLSAPKLQEVVITAPAGNKTVIPSQNLAGKELEHLQGHTVADALKLFAGVQIKDYGGVGGIKTVNIRSMGTHHVGVFYDGIELGNAQNGQVDLGMYAIENLANISLYNGQKSQIFQPAKDFGSSGSIYMTTRRPIFSNGSQSHVRATVRAGSFNLLNTSFLFENKLSEHLSSSFNAEWLNSTGKYKFRYRRVSPSGQLAYDTTAIRQNGDVSALRMDANIYGELPQGEWRVKGYTYHSERGIPGAIVNNVWRRGERLWDANSFVQGHWQKQYNRFSTQFNAKYAYYKTHYVNHDITQLEIDNLYKQQEFYLSTSNVCRINDYWEASISYDFQYNHLWADLYSFVMPTRRTHYLSAATAASWNAWKMQASWLFTGVNEQAETICNPPSKRVLTPALFLSYQPWESHDFSLRTFYKKAFRMPTFNDLYYADMGNSQLDPETTIQYDFGAHWNKSFDHPFWESLSLQADGYYNNVKNKIICYPKGQQFRWTTLNLGRVDIRGIDCTASLSVTPTEKLTGTLKAQYTWQRAIDVTDPADTYYGDQIPYIPWNSGTLVAQLDYQGWSLHYSFIYTGERYNQQENHRFNYTQPWYTSDVSVSKQIPLKGSSLQLLAECNNLLSQDYDVILNYPMPKRNGRISLTIAY